MDGYLSKPVTLDKLVQALDQALCKKKPALELDLSP